MTGGGGLLIVRLRVAVPTYPRFVALRATEEPPAALGVPVMAPEPVLTLNPAGRPVALKLVGLFVAVILYVYAVPLMPLSVKVLVMTGISMKAAVPASSKRRKPPKLVESMLPVPPMPALVLAVAPDR